MIVVTKCLLALRLWELAFFGLVMALVVAVTEPDAIGISGDVWDVMAILLVALLPVGTGVMLLGRRSAPDELARVSLLDNVVLLAAYGGAILGVVWVIGGALLRPSLSLVVVVAGFPLVITLVFGLAGMAVFVGMWHPAVRGARHKARHR